jgi:hypothetical protein
MRTLQELYKIFARTLQEPCKNFARALRYYDQIWGYKCMHVLHMFIWVCRFHEPVDFIWELYNIFARTLQEPCKNFARALRYYDQIWGYKCMHVLHMLIWVFRFHEPVDFMWELYKNFTRTWHELYKNFARNFH